MFGEGMTGHRNLCKGGNLEFLSKKLGFLHKVEGSHLLTGRSKEERNMGSRMVLMTVLDSRHYCPLDIAQNHQDKQSQLSSHVHQIGL